MRREAEDEEGGRGWDDVMAGWHCHLVHTDRRHATARRS